jgi:hypothetical protein
MRMPLALLVLAAGLWTVTAEAQTVFVPHGGRVVAVPLPPPAQGAPSSSPAPAEGGLVRVDGLPAGAMLAVDGRPFGGGADVGGAWIALPPGPHFIDVALPGAGAIRLTVVTPVETSGYQVVPKP